MSQAVAALHHLHRIGICHRDFRAANILIAATAPFRVVLADFGVSHQLRVYEEAGESLGTATGAGTAVSTVLTGSAALAPRNWAAPEMLLPQRGGVVATPACDVYMLGGLLFEVLTCGRPPFYWVPRELVGPRRLHTAGELFRPAGSIREEVGLLGQSVLDAAALDGIDVPWCVDRDDAPRSALIDVMERCLQGNPTARPSLRDVQVILEGLGQ